LAARKFSYILDKVGFKPSNPNFKIENMISTTDVGFPIRLEGIVLHHAKFASYEPELFPGLIYRMLDPKCVLLIFVSGKVVITGTKTDADLAKAMTKIHPTLEEFKKTTLTQQEREARDVAVREEQGVIRGFITQGGEEESARIIATESQGTTTVAAAAAKGSGST